MRTEGAVQTVWKWNTPFGVDHLRLVNTLYSLQSPFCFSSICLNLVLVTWCPLDLQREVHYHTTRRNGFSFLRQELGPWV